MPKTIHLFANWKMYLDYDESIALACGIAKHFNDLPDFIKMVVFPGALSVKAVADILKNTNVGVGAQNVYWVDKGGYTGEVSAHMYKSVGCDYCLVGHSERRHQFHESNHEVREKLEAALAANLIPVLCVGETIDERQNRKTEETIEIQLRSALNGLNWTQSRQLIIAYEPVWAISKGIGKDEGGLHCDEAEAQRIHTVIKKLTMGLLPDLEPVILFGGSIRPSSVVSYIKTPQIDGGLVGAASTNFDSWKAIVEHVTRNT